MMCIFLYTLFFLLGLGPSIQAQEMFTDISLMSSPEGVTASIQFKFSDNEAFTDKDSVVQNTTSRDTNGESSPTTPTIMKMTEMLSTAEDLTPNESHTAPSEDATTMSDLKVSTAQGSITTSTKITTIYTTMDIEPTSKQDESTAVFSSSESTVLTTEEKTTKLMQAISTTLAPTTESISMPPIFTNQPEISTQIPLRSTPTTPTTTPTTTTPTTTPTTTTPTTTTTTTTTPPTTTTTQKQLSSSTAKTQDKTGSTTNSTIIGAVEGGDNQSEKSFNWKIVVIIGLVSFCVLMILCIGLAMKHKNNSGKQNFGQMNGRPKKKKGAEDDVWAGPVNLGGVEKEDGNGPEEALVQGKDKPDGPDVMLSTFTMPDEKAAVGRPGSQEVKRWEEQERLLYIDEDAKGEEKDQKMDATQNGGEAYCLTTAV